MSASLVADAGQDWTVKELTKDQFGSGVTCTVTTCTFKCQMQRKLKTEETDKDVQMAIGDEETVLGGYRLYQDRTNDVVQIRGYSSENLTMRILNPCSGTCGAAAESSATALASMAVTGLVGLISLL